MIKGIEPFYQQIADEIQDAIAETWGTAFVEVAFFEDGASFYGEYTIPRQVRPKSFEVTDPAQEALEDIRELFRRAKKPLWGRARFEINSDGKFNLTWDYDDCDEQGFARWDEEVELKRTRDRMKRLGFS
jgi:hypothetical protein